MIDKWVEMICFKNKYFLITAYKWWSRANEIDNVVLLSKKKKKRLLFSVNSNLIFLGDKCTYTSYYFFLEYFIYKLI